MNNERLTLKRVDTDLLAQQQSLLDLLLLDALHAKAGERNGHRIRGYLEGTHALEKIDYSVISSMTIISVISCVPSCSPPCRQDCEDGGGREPRPKRMTPQLPHGRGIRRSGK